MTKECVLRKDCIKKYEHCCFTHQTHDPVKCRNIRRLSMTKQEWKVKEAINFKGIEYKENVIYYSREIGIAKFLCPSGCNKVESIKIGGTVDVVRKVWVLEIENGIPTLYHSVWTKFECDSHYFIKKGKTMWL